MVVNLMPHVTKPLAPKQENLDYILEIFKSHKTGVLDNKAIIKQSRLTRTQTLRSLEVLIEQGLISKGKVKNVFYL
jgi:DNA-binding IclR family transcriptional regulator